MRIDPDTCRDPDLLAAEVRRLKAVIAASDPVLTYDEREAIAGVILGRDNLLIHTVYEKEWEQNCDTLRGLLSRLGGGK